MTIIKTSLARLEASGPGPAADDPGGITGYIVKRYHQDLRRRLPGLIKLAKEVQGTHQNSSPFPSGLVDLLQKFTTDMFEHMDKEEQVLFPLINAGEMVLVKGPISRMELEHEQHGVNLRNLKEMTNGYSPPSDAPTAWKTLYVELQELESELMDHINMENNVLFPKALNTLMP